MTSSSAATPPASGTPMDDEVCVVPDCDWDLCCQMQGNGDSRCLLNWMNIDPEDQGLYSAYVAEVSREKRR